MKLFERLKIKKLEYLFDGFYLYIESDDDDKYNLRLVDKKEKDMYIDFEVIYSESKKLNFEEIIEIDLWEKVNRCLATEYSSYEEHEDPFLFIIEYFIGNIRNGNLLNANIFYKTETENSLMRFKLINTGDGYELTNPILKIHFGDEYIGKIVSNTTLSYDYDFNSFLNGVNNLSNDSLMKSIFKIDRKIDVAFTFHIYVNDNYFEPYLDYDHYKPEVIDFWEAKKVDEEIVESEQPILSSFATDAETIVLNPNPNYFESVHLESYDGKGLLFKSDIFNGFENGIIEVKKFAKCIYEISVYVIEDGKIPHNKNKGYKDRAVLRFTEDGVLDRVGTFYDYDSLNFKAYDLDLTGYLLYNFLSEYLFGFYIE